MIQEQISLDTLVPYLSGLDDWSLYEYVFWDDGTNVNILRPVKDSFPSLYKTVEQRFLRGGWEGDGEIEFGFLPPFCSNKDYTGCHLFFHVKQCNNGISLSSQIGNQGSLNI